MLLANWSFVASVCQRRSTRIPPQALTRYRLVQASGLCRDRRKWQHCAVILDHNSAPPSSSCQFSLMKLKWIYSLYTLSHDYAFLYGSSQCTLTLAGEQRKSLSFFKCVTVAFFFGNDMMNVCFSPTFLSKVDRQIVKKVLCRVLSECLFLHPLNCTVKCLS